MKDYLATRSRLEVEVAKSYDEAGKLRSLWWIRVQYDEWVEESRPLVKYVAQAQAKKLVEWLQEKQFKGSPYESVFGMSWVNWQELRRQVGLE